MHTEKVTNQQLSLEREREKPREGEVCPGALTESVTEDTGLELGLEELGGRGGCSTQGCCGKWSSASILLTLPPSLLPQRPLLATGTHCWAKEQIGSEGHWDSQHY